MGKKLLILLATLGLALSGCSVFQSGLNPVVIGSGKMASDTRQVSGFTAVSLQGSGDVQIAFGDQESAVIEAEDNLLPLIETIVQNGELVIRTRPNTSMTTTKSIRISLTMKSLDRVDISGSGNITVPALAADAFRSSLSGSGAITVNGTANQVDIAVGGSGNVFCQGLQARIATVNIAGSGNVTVYASQKLEATISGSGSIRYSGSPAEVKQNVAGSGTIVADPASPSQPTASPTSQDPAPTAQASDATEDGFSYQVDPTLSGDVSVERIAAVPNTPGSAWWGPAPEYRQVTLSGYPVGCHAFEPQIYILPVEDYRTANANAAPVIDQLQSVLQTQQKVDEMPFLPLINMKPVMNIQQQYLDFKNGHGLRSLIQLGQGMTLVSNYLVFYTFQGLSSDGQYYLAAILPVTHPSLPANDQMAMQTQTIDMSNYGHYLADTAFALETQAPDTFTPSLAQLDALMSSIEIQAVQPSTGVPSQPAVYLLDRASNDPLHTVKCYLTAKMNDDYDAWKSALWAAQKDPANFSPTFEKPGDLGVLSLSIGDVAVSGEETERIRKEYTGSDLANRHGWSDGYLAENMIAVSAEYTVDYDNTEVSYPEGTLAHYFYLVRDGPGYPWLVWDMSTSD